MLTHRNRLCDSLKANITAKLNERSNSKKKEKPLPEWLTDMLVPSPVDPEAFVNPVCAMPTKLDPLASLASSRANPYMGLRPGHITRSAFYKLAYGEALEAVLKHKEFVEFPTIEVWEEGAFTGTVVDDRGSVVHKFDDEYEEDGPKPKRRKLSRLEGKKAIGGLLGGYGSESDEDGENAKDEKNVLGLLSGYAASDDEENVEADVEERKRVAFESQFDYELGDEDAEGETDDGEDFEEEEGWGDEAAPGRSSAQSPEALAALLEQLRRDGALRDPGGDLRFNHLAANDEEQVDWGDSADEEDS